MLLKLDGEIKLSEPEMAYGTYSANVEAANHENCHIADGSAPSDVRAVGYITMELMQKYSNDSDAIGIEVLNCWATDSVWSCT